MEQLKTFFSECKINSILDVGTGSGDFITVLRNVFPKAKITGADPDDDSLQEAQKRFPDCSFLKMNAEHLEFAENSFDLASISMALHHLTDIQKALIEMQRVVKPGGWIIVNELFSNNLNHAQEVHKMYHHFRSSIDRLTGINHNETFEKEQIIRMINDAGISVKLDFENREETNLIASPGELDIRIEKMKQNLEKIKGLPEYEIYKPQIEAFRQRALLFGFQPATRIVVVGRAK
ncbi:MAG: methyltransferase domain-containing protein [Bacteroidetes bacterium]|nr:MAG: methyltransferase domain-containing protein [Bacteroidota bacterium]